MHYRTVKDRIGNLAILVIAFGALCSTAAMAARVGQIGSANVELRTVTIDGRQYQLARDAELSYADDPDRVVWLSRLHEGQAVEYELAATGQAVVVRLTVLTAD